MDFAKFDYDFHHWFASAVLNMGVKKTKELWTGGKTHPVAPSSMRSWCHIVGSLDAELWLGCFLQQWGKWRASGLYDIEAACSRWDKLLRCIWKYSKIHNQLIPSGCGSKILHSPTFFWWNMSIWYHFEHHYWQRIYCILRKLTIWSYGPQNVQQKYCLYFLYFFSTRFFLSPNRLPRCPKKIRSQNCRKTTGTTSPVQPSTWRLTSVKTTSQHHR